MAAGPTLTVPIFNPVMAVFVAVREVTRALGVLPGNPRRGKRLHAETVAAEDHVLGRVALHAGHIVCPHFDRHALADKRAFLRHDQLEKRWPFLPRRVLVAIAKHGERDRQRAQNRSVHAHFLARNDETARLVRFNRVDVRRRGTLRERAVVIGQLARRSPAREPDVQSVHGGRARRVVGVTVGDADAKLHLFARLHAGIRQAGGNRRGSPCGHRGWEHG